MADAKTDFEIYLKSKWDGDAMKAAEADFRKTQKAVKETGTSVDDLKKSLMEMVAAAAVISFLKDATEGALEMEKALRLVDMTAVKMGLGVEETRKKVDEFAKELSALAGVEDDEIVKAVGKAFAATHDLGQAFARAAVAADLATKYSLDYGEAANLVAEAARGKTRALDKLTGTTTAGKDATEKAANAMKFLQENMKGASSATNDHVMQVARLHAQWKEFKDTVGEWVLKFIDWLRDGFFNVGNGIGMVIVKMTNWATATVDILGALGQAVKDTLAGNFKEAETYFTKVREIAKRTTELNNLAEDDAEKRDRTYYEGKKKRIADIVTEQLKANKKIEEEGGKEEKKRGLTQAEADQVEAGKLQAKMIAAAEKELEKFEAYKKALRKQGLADEKKLISDMDKERDSELDRAIKRTVEEVRAKKAAAAAEKQLASQTADAALALGDQVFEGNKEWSIASAMIATFRAVAGQLAMEPVGPWNIALAAIMLASGLAQVAKIESTSVGGGTAGAGFDDPGNDAAARIGGRRWAADMIGEFTGGVSEGWAQGMRAGGGNSTTTNDNRRTFNVHMHGAGFIDPNNIQMMKQFKRTLDVIDRTVEGQRHLARTAR